MEGKTTKREWKESRGGKDLPLLSEFLSFLKDRLDLLQCLGDEQLTHKPLHNKELSKFVISYKNRSSHMNLAVNKSTKCNYCKDNHTIFKCPEFKALSVDKRIQKVQGLNLCPNCLLQGHDNNNDHTTPPTADTVNNLVNTQNHVLLSTVMCQVKDEKGKFHSCRALLDCGAQSNLVTEKFCKKLNVTLENANFSVIGINKSISNLNKKCSLTILSNHNTFENKIVCLVVPTITLGIPSAHFNTSDWHNLSHINLADPSFECPRDIDLLLGANIFWDLLLKGTIELGKNTLCNLAKVQIPEDEQLRKFWEQEDIKPQEPLMTKDEQVCEVLFKENTYKAENGQFVVKFPLKCSPSDATLKKLYSDFIHEYEDLGHMSKISDDLSKNSGFVNYFLPRRGILKDSLTTQLRIKLWSLHVAWDSHVPTEIENQCIHFQNDLVNLNSFEIPRNAIHFNHSLFNIHCFCDASTDAYAAALYLRSIIDVGEYSVNLLCSKTKVSPLKTITIPRLELCASLLGSQLVSIVITALSVSVPIHMWSDSQVAISWINTEPSLLQVFVANRVSKIQSLTSNENWKYVASKSNPADIASRGTIPKGLLNNILWWKGPTFLYNHESEWPTTNFSVPVPNSDLPVLKKSCKVINVVTCTDIDLFNRLSSLTKLIRVAAYCLRFKNNLRPGTVKRSGVLTPKELNNANICLIKLAQRACFHSELELLRKNECLNKKHRLSSLSPFIDESGIIRVGGRLKTSDLPYNTKHPILLSSKHQFTKLIFEHKHKLLMHPGPQLLLASVRQYYWPVGGTSLSKQIVKQCITCFKFKPIPLEAPMASLTDNRLQPQLPFTTVGIDYAGPLTILNKKGRGAKLLKCYIAIFVCFCTKAVHIEVISDLTTENFLCCLRRFISRRGLILFTPAMELHLSGLTTNLKS
nr:unnamed protein product [Callosobruchus analis]